MYGLCPINIYIVCIYTYALLLVLFSLNYYFFVKQEI